MDEVVDAFRKSSFRELRGIKIAGDRHKITLTGTVPSFYIKQVANELVKKRFPKLKLLNHLEVVAIPKKIREIS